MTGRFRLAVGIAVLASLITISGLPAPVGAATTVTPVRIVGGSGHAGLYGWGAATLNDGSVLIGDYWNFRIQRWNDDGTNRRTYTNRVSTDATKGVGAPYDVAVDMSDIPTSGPLQGLANFWVADQEQADVVEFNHNGQVIRTLGVDGTGSYQHGFGCSGGNMSDPTHLAIDPNNPTAPAWSEACAPKMTRLRTSRPNSSVPIRWVRLGGWRSTRKSWRVGL